MTARGSSGITVPGTSGFRPGIFHAHQGIGMDIALSVIAGEWIVFFVFIFLLGFIYGGKVEKISQWYFGRSVLFIIAAVIAIFVIRRLDPGIIVLRVIPDSAITGLAGVLLATAGLAFAAWARIHLGKYWSSMVIVKEGHHLIRTGPYRIVRNPMYTGILAALFGAAIAIGLLMAFVVLGIIVAGIWLKIRAEEEILQEKFGEEYLRFRREVKALIPWIL
jgi:protein-S-isoprenylcysteine O-methyltransferase Ste14